MDYRKNTFEDGKTFIFFHCIECFRAWKLKWKILYKQKKKQDPIEEEEETNMSICLIFE